jgi:hypothetical protein
MLSVANNKNSKDISKKRNVLAYLTGRIVGN